MAGYRCVNFYDLCRLCSSVKDEKNVQIFTTDGLLKKINDCLPITLSEKDKLPKIICSSCHEYIEIFSEFRKSCSNAQKMLEGCLNSTKLRNGGQVYIKDEVPVKKVLKPIQNSSPNKILSSINIVASSPNKSIKKNVITPNQPDFLSSIMQAVGIQVTCLLFLASIYIIFLKNSDIYFRLARKVVRISRLHSPIYSKIPLFNRYHSTHSRWTGIQLRVDRFNIKLKMLAICLVNRPL